MGAILGVSAKLCVLMALAGVTTLSSAIADPFRLNAALETPDWFEISGESRVRYETLDHQFRANGSGSDQLLLFRSLVHVRAHHDSWTFGLELQDSRTYLADAGTPLSSSIANPLDILQLYARYQGAPGLLGEGSNTDLRLGRLTVSIGSKRQIERVDFANVIKSYSGLHAVSQNDADDELHLLYVVPTARFPSSRPALDDNEISGDEEQWGRRIWAVHYRKADILPGLVDDLWGEVFVYGLEEEDRDAFQTPNRSYVSPGFRLYRQPKRGQWDIDFEGALRQGTRYASSSPTDTQSLDVDAAMTFFALGYTFEVPLQPRFAFEYYYASGDEDPNDLRYDQHERLFGSRRSDLNNTSIHGPLTPANLSAPGFRLEVKSESGWDARFYYHAAHLAESADSWVIARLRDPAGQSGQFIGHVLDGRARYWLVEDSLRVEVGASALFPGEFPKEVAAGRGEETSVFTYGQLTFSF